MSMLRHIWLILICLPFLAVAQSIEVQVSADRVEQGETFLVTFTYDNKVKDFKLPGIQGFDVFNSGTSTNIYVANGKVSKSTSHTLTLRALTPGTFNIGPATGSYQGKPIVSAVFKVVVEPNASSPQQGPPGGGSGPEPQITSANWRDNIFVVAKADKLKVFAGEAITLTYTLYRRMDYRTLELSKEPVFKGFLSEYMEVPENEQETYCSYKGREYYCQTFRKIALFPTQVGRMTVEPLSLKGVILLEEQDPFFGMFSTTEPKAVSFSSNAVNIEVMPLPLEGQPQNFSGIVGEYEVSRSLNKRQVSAGQSVVMDLSISGTGNIRAISPPEIPVPSGVDVFEPEINDSFLKASPKFGGTRSFQYALVPKKAGELILPSQEFNWFDPAKGTYVQVELEALAMQVTRESGAETAAEGPQSSEPILQNRQGFKAPVVQKVWPFALAGTLPFLAVFFLLFYYKRSKQPEQQKRSEEVSWPVFGSDNRPEDYLHLARHLKAALCQSLKWPEQSTDSVVLSAVNDQHTQDRLRYILQACERAAYSPLPSEPVQQLSTQAQALLQNIQSAQSKLS
jgi:hypothetical protein